MTKQELMKTYTVEQLAEMVEKRTPFADKELIQKWKELAEEFHNGYCKVLEENERLQYKAEKYRKAFEDAKKERDCQIAECQKKIDELNAENSELHCELQTVAAIPEEIPTEPIKVADMIINELYTRDYIRLNISELRQIAEHLLVYCNHNGEAEE